MKILVAGYSRTGTSLKVGREISKVLNADFDEIKDLTDRSGVGGWLRAGRDAMKKSKTEIKFEKDPSKYDLIIIGGPVWAGSVTPAIRVYLEKNSGILKNKKLAFFDSKGGKGEGKTFEQMEELSKKPLASLMLLTKEVSDENYVKKVEEFCKKLKQDK